MNPILIIAAPMYLVGTVIGLRNFPILRHIFPYALTAERFEVRLFHVVPLSWIDYRRMVRVYA